MAKKDNTQEIEDTQVDGNLQNDVATEADTTETLSEVDQLKNDLEAEKDKFLRLFAEFENYKRRTTKERLELFKTAGQEVIQSLLPV